MVGHVLHVYFWLLENVNECFFVDDSIRAFLVEFLFDVSVVVGVRLIDVQLQQKSDDGRAEDFVLRGGGCSFEPRKT